LERVGSAASLRGRQDGMTGKSIRRVSLAELDKLPDRTRVDAPDGPELGKSFWKNARLVMPEKKTSVHLRVDAEVFDWFKAQGRGHLTRMNAVLRSFYEAHKRGSR
jgi:uncharacterized protein (DUF4415 family)